MYDRRWISPLLLAASRTRDISYLGIPSRGDQRAKFFRRRAFQHLVEIRLITLTLSPIVGVLAVRMLVIVLIQYISISVRHSSRELRCFTNSLFHQ